MKCRRSFLFFLLLTATAAFRALGQNDKLVLGPQILSPIDIAQGAKILYLIRFQNFGGDTARNISIRDTLDPRLDLSTFEMVDASHQHTIIRGGEVVRWYFNDIALPDSNENSILSKGYILFGIRPKADVAPGQVIRNRAHIYFDGAQIVRTNEVVVRIDEEGATGTPDWADLLAFPNPNNGIFDTNADLSNPDSHALISDASGKSTPFKTIETDTGSRVFLENIEPGIYYLQTRIEGALHVFPFVVVR